MWIDRSDPDTGIEPNPAGIPYFGDTFRGHEVADLCERYNRGERLV